MTSEGWCFEVILLRFVLPYIWDKISTVEIQWKVAAEIGLDSFVKLERKVELGI